MNIKTQISDTFKNVLKRKAKLVYIIEPTNWSIKWDGHYITQNINRQTELKAKISSSRIALQNKIVHFGSLGTFIKPNKGIVEVSKSNKVVFTWFHIPDNDARIKHIPELNEKTDIVHTSCEITKNVLIENGLSSEKIEVIPIGIDLQHFKTHTDSGRLQIKQRLNLPDNKAIIGSFQKDGAGWGEGLEPKLIKGPDVFCDAVEKIAQSHDIHVLLTGPARGYVKKRLEKANISYTHHFLENYLDIADYYNALDLYIVSSRAEGGPKAITESMASGVPVISTKAGMAPEVISDGENGFLCEIENSSQIAETAIKVLSQKHLQEKLKTNAAKDVQKYDWANISKAYYDKIYRKLL